MKPVVGSMNAWSCVVISTFAIVILSVIGALFKTNNHLMTGTTEAPEDSAAAAGAVFGAVVVYGCFWLFCGFQALLHLRDSRKGQIALS